MPRVEVFCFGVELENSRVPCVEKPWNDAP